MKTIMSIQWGGSIVAFPKHEIMFLHQTEVPETYQAGGTHFVGDQPWVVYFSKGRWVTSIPHLIVPLLHPVRAELENCGIL